MRFRESGLYSCRISQGDVHRFWSVAQAHSLSSLINRYGRSTKPLSEDSRAHSKREMGKDIVHCVDSLFGEKRPIIVFGHDRGARLAYRLALDLPARIVGAAVLDIVPTAFVWDAMRIEKDHVETKRSHHWVSRTVVCVSKIDFMHICADHAFCSSSITGKNDCSECSILLRTYHNELV